jgi:hypothetical protein
LVTTKAAAASASAALVTIKAAAAAVRVLTLELMAIDSNSSIQCTTSYLGLIGSMSAIRIEGVCGHGDRTE